MKNEYSIYITYVLITIKPSNTSALCSKFYNHCFRFSIERKIALMHDYNEIKDLAQSLLGELGVSEYLCKDTL